MQVAYIKRKINQAALEHDVNTYNIEVNGAKDTVTVSIPVTNLMKRDRDLLTLGWWLELSSRYEAYICHITKTIIIKEIV